MCERERFERPTLVASGPKGATIPNSSIALRQGSANSVKSQNVSIWGVVAIEPLSQPLNSAIIGQPQLFKYVDQAAGCMSIKLYL